MISIVMAGLALASCINEKDSGGTTSSFTASPTVGGTDLRTITGWPNGNTATFDGFNVTLSNNGTVAKFTCPAGSVSFTGEKTCNNTAGGCDFGVVQVIYNSTDPENDGWSAVTDQHFDATYSTAFTADNVDVNTGGKGSALICIPDSQVSYWS